MALTVPRGLRGISASLHRARGVVSAALAPPTADAAPARGTPFHLAFPVHNLAAARAFYGGVLGCAEGRSSDRWQDYSLAGHQIVCHWVKNGISRPFSLSFARARGHPRRARAMCLALTAALAI